MAHVQMRNMLDVCGVPNQPTELFPGGPIENPAAQFVNSSGMREPEHLLSFKYTDMAEIVKTHNRRPGMVYIDAMTLKNIEALVFYARYNWRRGLQFGDGDWDVYELETAKSLMTKVIAMKADKSGESIDPGPIDTGGGYRNWIGRFKNKLKATIGAADVPLYYVIRDDADRPDPMNTLEVDAYDMRLDGPEFEQDSKAVYTILYNCCNHDASKGKREALTWIEPHADQGREAYIAFCAHYEGNGPDQTRKAEAHAQIKALHWKNETALAFSTFASHLKDAYNIVSKDAPYHDSFKVRDMLDKMKPTSKVMEVEYIKGHARTNFLNDFDAAITYLTGEIATIYAEEISRINKFGGKRNRTVYETNVNRSQGNRGRGGRGGRGRGGRSRGSGGRGNGGRNNRDGNYNSSNRVTFNGVDATDVDKAFSPEEWDRMGPAGRAFINNERARRNGGGGTYSGGQGRGQGRGGQRSQQGRGGGNNSNNRVVNEVQVPDANDMDTHSQNDAASSITSRGGRSGSGFGRGAHGSRT